MRGYNIPKEPAMSKPKIILIIAITLLALCLRAYLAVVGLIEYDEPVYLDVAAEYAGDIRNGNWANIQDSRNNYEHPILYKLIYASALALRPTVNGIDKHNIRASTSLANAPYYPRLLALRLVSVLFGALSVLLLAFVNPIGGLFLAINTYAIKYTSVIYLEAFPLFCSIASVSAFELYLSKKKKDATQRRNDLWLAMSAFALGLAVSSKVIYGIAGVGLFIPQIIQNRKNLSLLLKPALIWGLAFVATFFLVNVNLWPNPVQKIQEIISFHFSFSAGASTRKAYPFWQPISWLAIPIPWQAPKYTAFFIQPGDFPLPLDTVIFFFAILGIKRLYRMHPIYFWWLAIGLGFLLVWKTKWPQYILPVLAPFCLSAGLGVSVCWEAIKNVRRRGLKAD